MVKGSSKLMKLKSMIKKWQSASKLGRTSSTIAAEGLQPVYVGKSRRRYLISSHLVDHPLFRELLDKSSSPSDDVVVACEVVLFEHLLWMLENTDPQLESLDDLVDFYAC